MNVGHGTRRLCEGLESASSVKLKVGSQRQKREAARRAESASAGRAASIHLRPRSSRGNNLSQWRTAVLQNVDAESGDEDE